MSARKTAADRRAAEWVVKMSERPLSPDARRQLKLWLDADPSHPEALEYAQLAWKLMGQVPASAEPAPSHSPARALPRRYPLPLRPLALAACLLVALVVGAITAPSAYLPLADYRTGLGEQQRIHLDDGSFIQLGPDSAIDIDYSSTQRLAILRRGLAVFHPSPAEGGGRPPFVVHTDDSQIRALGTRFSVERLDDTTLVAVQQHSVAVTRAQGRQAPTILQQGQALMMGPDGNDTTPVLPLGYTTAWLDGKLIFQREPLARVIARLNRYHPGKIVIAGRELGKRQVSGVFNTTDSSHALQTIANELNASVWRAGPLLTLLY